MARERRWKTTATGDVWQILQDLFFWLGIACEVVVSPSGYLFGNYREKLIIVLGMGCFALSILAYVMRDIGSLRREWWIYLLLGAYGLACYRAQHSALILRIALILLAGRGRRPRDVVRVFFWATLAMMALGAALAAGGLHNGLALTQSFRHEEETRYTFGFYHPNGFSFFLFRLYVMGIYVYGGRGRWRAWLPIWLACSAGVLYLFYLCGSRMGMGIGAFLFLCGTALRPAEAGSAAWRAQRRGGARALYFLLWLAGFVVMAAESLLIVSLRCYDYPELNPGQTLSYWDYMNEWTSGRLDHARRALLQTPYTWLGSRDVPDGTEIGFVNAFLFQGALFLLIFLATTLYVYTRCCYRHDVYGMLMALAFFLYAMAEAYLPYFNKNGIWMLAIGLPQIRASRARPGHEGG